MEKLGFTIPPGASGRSFENVSNLGVVARPKRRLNPERKRDCSGCIGCTLGGGGDARLRRPQRNLIIAKIKKKKDFFLFYIID